MALYPNGGPRPTSSNAELAFYKALMKGLPPGWQAWHSLKLRLGKDWEGEGDFVIAVPKRAIVIVEVKGGAIECRDGQWFQNGKPMRAPRDQAHRFRNILGTTLAKTVSVPPILIITAFPDTPFQLPPSHGDLADAVLGQQDLTWLGDALASLVERLLRETPPFGDTGWSAALHRLWGDTWVPRISLGTRIQLRDQELVPLDQEQLLYLDMLDHSERLLVTGGPGTGKTLLARTLCARRAPALYLCWTRALAQAMRGPGIDAWTVREYAGKLLEDAGQADGGPPSTWTTDYWEQVAFQAAIDAVPDAPAHAIVVVDEAQDFSENDWELVRALSTKCQLWAFGDQGQSFWAERTMPKGMFPASFQLRARYRCPSGLAAFADRYRGIESDVPVTQTELRIVRTSQGETPLDRVKLEIVRAMRDGAKQGDIAVLTLQGQAKSELLRQKRLGDVAIVRADAEDAGEHVVADTFLRFKGLERPYVIVTELETSDKYDVRMHIALTRATMQAVVIGTDRQIDADPRLRM